MRYVKDGKQTVLGVRFIKVLLAENALKGYPNPTKGVLNLEFEANMYKKIELIELTGKILMSKTLA